ncbi:cyclic nucleotide-binding domain-containing protein [Nostoc sphaeroides CHAB 2801]|uniref:cyclic nucleotide-binding domain-containing protein n=1 Tax=Nostoc sphaeroides TaxID=446679 RepID=UPI001E3C7D0B|nr:cyclic nucleotide-binding domain-containing protein [Nostoc sphaeroides]MCC5633237.1 cyclic nucleotide-binding domain-containing protein [Nostoc sphaeroides CHAB 2801]
MSLNKYIHLSIQQGLNSETESIVTFQTQPVAAIVEQPLPLITDDVTADEKVVEDCQNWLNSHPVWGQLPAEALKAIAQSFHCFVVEPQTLIYQEGQTPIGLYFLKSGTVEIFQRSQIGQLLIRYRNAGDLFGHTLIANAVAGTYQTSAISL